MMKIFWITLGMVSFALSNSIAQGNQPAREPTPTGFTVTERGPHHKAWERIEYEPAPDGRQLPHKRTYTEVATGLHFKNEQGEWQESEPKIEVLPNDAGAMAAKGQHKVIFPPEITSGLIELQTPEGQWLRSRVWGLAYFDAATGESVLIAEVKESEGQLVGDNVVNFPNAFTDLRADVRYTYTRAKFEQDVVLRENPPAPEEFNLNPETTRLQVLTEFVEAPEPGKTLKQAGGLPDASLHFGAMDIGAGKAFSVGSGKKPGEHVPVAKSWGQMEGRTFLLEEAPYKKVSGELEKLPAAGKYEGAKLERRGKGASTLAGLKNLMPKRYAKRTPQPDEQPKLMARVLPKHEPGFVMDYVTLNTAYTNYIFKGDTTYYISDTTTLKSNTVVEGGTVIKFNTTGDDYLDLVDGTIECRTAPYRPAVFTSKHDNSVGETISGSTGSPSVISSSFIVGIGSAAELTLSNVRMSYINCGLFLSGMNLNLTDSQFETVDYALYCEDGTVTINNVLLHNISGAALAGWGPSLKAEHLTVNKCHALLETAFTATTFTNCLFVSVTNWGGTFTSFHNATNANSSSVFQTVGGGAHYLTNNSDYRNVGSTNIEADLQSRLRARTTYPPIAYTNVTFTNPLTFNPQAQRDTDIPDLGYHYDPLDYSFGGCAANSNVTFTAGTAVGWFATNGTGAALSLATNVTMAFEGTALEACRWVQLKTVQEYDRTHSAGYGAIGLGDQLSTASKIQTRFTKCSILGLGTAGGYHFRDKGNGEWLTLIANHSEFFGGGIGGYSINLFLTNCLFDRVYLWENYGGNNSSQKLVFQNCTIRGGTLQFYPMYSIVQVAIRDCALDGPTLNFGGYASDPIYAYYDYNAYTNASSPFPLSGSHNVPSVNFNWQTSWLGNFYLPSDSPLIDEGSITAPTAGLYHFTTQTNGFSKETTSQVDIGYHYVAVDSAGVPVDSDGDGVSDYLEDTNGNGEVNSGETDWMYSTGYWDRGLRVLITEPKRSANLP